MSRVDARTFLLCGARPVSTGFVKLRSVCMATVSFSFFNVLGPNILPIEKERRGLEPSMEGRAFVMNLLSEYGIGSPYSLIIRPSVSEWSPRLSRASSDSRADTDEASSSVGVPSMEWLIVLILEVRLDPTVCHFRCCISSVRPYSGPKYGRQI